jgi:hypothetical protein
VVVVGAHVVQQPPGQLLAVELAEEVLVADVRQQLDHLVQRVVDGLVAADAGEGREGGAVGAGRGS